MTQVSKYLIKPEVWDRIFDMFLESFLAAKNKNSLNGFVHSIFTPTERIMLAKRFAACVLLAKGNDYRSVARVLRMSPPTIAKMSFKLKYEGEGLMPIIENALRKQEKSILWEEFKNLSDLPSKGGSDAERGKRKPAHRQKIDRIKGRF